ncbi:hypothetical protein A2Z33_07415 [Candidatus Gottesmanbacteria bacterium RBG_16_52_11]|uniref:Uncharacterized protein n=1 Tax=Candidatus Gottesmanbacteria bacterium RBG_16_52_11 TaxID=1798374 RepID=A0A1F5YY10_9BACT|nr:MAG: hypothetical protein A2Z33_07415 [Candidatus Gottesmanbacteria bacterium RBG_16_52_11]
MARKTGRKALPGLVVLAVILAAAAAFAAFSVNLRTIIDRSENPTVEKSGDEVYLLEKDLNELDRQAVGEQEEKEIMAY